VSIEEVEEAARDSTLGDELHAYAGFEEDVHRSIRFFQHGIDRLEGVAGWAEVYCRRPAALARQFLLDLRRGVSIHKNRALARILRVTPSVTINAPVRAAGGDVDRRHARKTRQARRRKHGCPALDESDSHHIRLPGKHGANSRRLMQSK